MVINELTSGTDKYLTYCKTNNRKPLMYDLYKYLDIDYNRLVNHIEYYQLLLEAKLKVQNARQEYYQANGLKQKHMYDKCQMTPKELKRSIDSYLQYCKDNKVSPTMSELYKYININYQYISANFAYDDAIKYARNQVKKLRKDMKNKL